MGCRGQRCKKCKPTVQKATKAQNRTTIPGDSLLQERSGLLESIILPRSERTHAVDGHQSGQPWPPQWPTCHIPLHAAHVAQTPAMWTGQPDCRQGVYTRSRTVWIASCPCRKKLPMQPSNLAIDLLHAGFLQSKSRQRRPNPHGR